MDKYIKEYILDYWDKRYPIIDGVAQINENMPITRRIEYLFGVKIKAAGKLWEHWLDTRLSEDSHPIHFIHLNETYYFWTPKHLRHDDIVTYHREDGPAVIYSDGSEEWWVKGEYIPKFGL